jgi:hypothetical protein
MVDEFDSFARQQEELEQQRRNLVSDVKPEWAVLKGLVSRFALDEKKFDGYKFEWTPYQSMWPEFLRLNDVAAIFSDRGSAYVVLQDCKVRFARRPLKSGGEFWQDAESPLDQIEWSLNPVARGDSVAWYVPELQKTLSSSALAEQIAIELSRYHTAYQKAYGR